MLRNCKNGSISIKPERRDFDIDPLSHKDIRDEPDEGEEEDEEGEDSGDTQGALLHGKKWAYDVSISTNHKKH